MDGKIVIIYRQGGIDKVSCTSNSSLLYVLFQVAKGCVPGYRIPYSSILVGQQKRKEETLMGCVGCDDQTQVYRGMGFRDLELFNLALIARQAWRVLIDDESLSAQILKAAYYPNGSLLDATLGPHPSQIWRAILDGRYVLAQGVIRRIGDGETTSIWDHNWIPRPSFK